MSEQLEPIEWSESYSFGLPDIDSEHKSLFAAIERLRPANTEDLGGDIEVNIAIDFLFNYIKEHFDAEEALFIQTDYPLVEKHKRAHEYYKKPVATLKEKVLINRKEAVDDFIPIAVKWLSHHILEEDRGYVSYCKEKGVGLKSRSALD